MEQGRIEVPCVNGDADKNRSANYETVLKLRIFFGSHRSFSMANSLFDRHGPRLIPNNCQHLNPPYFSLPTTFKEDVFQNSFLFM
jgi:hypothetical protein